MSTQIMVFFIPRKHIPHTGMRSHLVGLDVCFLVGPFVCFHTPCKWTAKALARHAQPSIEAKCLIFVGPFVYFHTSFVRTAKALARLCGCAGSPESSADRLCGKYHNLMSWLKWQWRTSFCNIVFFTGFRWAFQTMEQRDISSHYSYNIIIIIILPQSHCRQNQLS